jgi:AGZA family xanthine/uracil permease-like MFS transporter
LVVVGILMLEAAKGVEFDDLSELLPAVSAVALTVFTYNIANGLAAALLLAPFAKAATGRLREVKLAAWVLAGLASSYFLFGIRH